LEPFLAMAGTFNPKYANDPWFVNKAGDLQFLLTNKDNVKGGHLIRDGGKVQNIAYSSTGKIADESPVAVVRFTCGSGLYVVRYSNLDTAISKRKADAKVPAIKQLATNLQQFVSTYPCAHRLPFFSLAHCCVPTFTMFLVFPPTNLITCHK
jgi:hypothetical protein